MIYDDHVLFNYCNSSLVVSNFISFDYGLYKNSNNKYNEVLAFKTSAYYEFYIYSYGSGKICRLLIYKDDKLLLKKEKLDFKELKFILDHSDSFLCLK